MRSRVTRTACRQEAEQNATAPQVHRHDVRPSHIEQSYRSSGDEDMLVAREEEGPAQILSPTC